MLDPKIESALNSQMQHEMRAAHHYLAMSAYLDRVNLGGFAAWMMAQRDEELEHAQRLYRYILDRGGRVELESIDRPPHDFDGLNQLFDRALEMEKENTRGINELYEIAAAQSDFATQSHLQWFLDEQVEEEKLFDEVRSLLAMAKNDTGALLILDGRMGERAAARPTSA